MPLELKDDFTLVFGSGMAPVAPVIRDFSAMKNYLKDPFSTYWRRDVYHIYRDIGLPSDLEAIHASGLEYDLTIIPPGLLGDEYAKTIGHYHLEKPGTAVRYPEVYEVLYGQVFWLLQRASSDLERLLEVFLISASRGEKLVVPPGFGHVTINPADNVAVLATWQARGMQGVYESYEARNGAAYYVVRSELLSKSGKTSAEYEFVPNLHYNQVPALKRVSVRELPQFDLKRALPMYFTAKHNLKTLDFLSNPENYLDELVPDKLFVPQKL